MNLSRRNLLTLAAGLPALWLPYFEALAAAQARQVKITAIKVMGLDNVGDGSLVNVENVLGPFRGYKEQMASGPTPVVRNSTFPVPEGPGLGLELNEDWLRAHVAKGDAWWG